MRTNLDRIRHALLYEVLFLILLIPLGAVSLKQTQTQVGAICIAGAMYWNYIFNLAFDKNLLALKRPLCPRGLLLRTTHALLPEGSLLLISIPALIWWLEISVLQALTIDLGFILLTPGYTLLYNWGYDYIFPINENAVQFHYRVPL